MTDTNPRDSKAQRALWGGLRRFTDDHGIAHPEVIDAEFFAIASVVFEDNGEWCWAVSCTNGERRGGVEATKEAAKAAAQGSITG